MIFDTHAHFDDEAFDPDREESLDRQFESGVGRIVDCGADIETSEKALMLADRYEHVFAAAGVHPDNIGECEDSSKFEKLKKMAEHEKCVAIGEIGLDYHWDVYPRSAQKDGFIAQWKLAASLSLPVVIHSRDAAEDTLKIVSMMHEEITGAGKPFMADMHCYSYSAEHAAEYIRMGLYFGIGGVLTFRNARKLVEVASMLPMDRILLETDCPYLAPEPYRGKRNESSYLKGVAEKLAQIRNMPVSDVERITYENACRFFGLT